MRIRQRQVRVEESLWKAAEAVKARGTTLALLLFSLTVFMTPVLIYEVVAFVRFPETFASNLFWGSVLLTLPALVTSVAAGLLAALGAFTGSRASQRLDATTRSTGVRAQSVRAGIGGAVGSVPIVLLFSVRFVGGAAVVPIVVLGVLIVFIGFVVFTTLWCRRVDRVRSAAPPSSGTEVAGW